MVPENPPQAEGRMQIPSVFAGAKRAVQINLAAVPILDRPPHLGPLEILENPSEKHVISLLFDVHAAGPITNVQAIAAEPAVEKLVALLTAQIPDPRSQMRPHRSADLPFLANRKFAAHSNGAILHGDLIRLRRC
ncbi:hypothetical protein ACFX10_031233 [Malus domestica]